MTVSIESALVLMGIPSAVTAMCFWMLQRSITKREKLREEKELAREQGQIFLIQSVGASLALGEATANAIKNNRCNGEMTAALDYAQKVKHAHKDFMTAQSVKNLY